MKLRDIAIGANASMYYRLNFKKIKGVYYPRTEADVLAAIAFAREHGYEVTPKGGGSGLSGACTGGDRERIMMSSLQMTQVLNISKELGYADVQPGATPDEINAILEPIGMKFYVAPSSRDIATVGGILSTDGGGNDTWVNGTMRDNTIKVKMVTYDGRRLTVSHDGVSSDDPDLEAELNRIGMNIHDVASSHGTLGFITELKVIIRPLVSEKLVGALAEFGDCNQLGQAVDWMIKRNSPIRYGETIVTAHPDVREGFNPPLLILQYPETYEDELKQFVDIQRLDKEGLGRMKDIRIKLPKRNPKEGVQFALFEGYGFHEESLRNMQYALDEIDALLQSNNLAPFGKYGHAPSKWYLGNNSPTYGIILHSREIRPEGKTGPELLQILLDIVDKCEELGVTPKPEHKWPFSDKAKRDRVEQIRKVLGQGFNSFILDEECDDVLSSMV